MLEWKAEQRQSKLMIQPKVEPADEDIEAEKNCTYLSLHVETKQEQFCKKFFYYT
jgi:hypothetical protein